MRYPKGFDKGTVELGTMIFAESLRNPS